MANKLFGTDGVRGVANSYPMTAEFVTKLGTAAGTKFCNKYKKVAIARDTRISGEMIETAVAAGFMAAGVDVVLLGILPTPALSAITPDLGVDMSVMITASHNPYQDNGIKLINSEGYKFADADTLILEEAIEDGDFELSPDRFGAKTEHKDAIVMYLEKVKQITDNPAPLEGLRVVIDCANGVYSSIMPYVFKHYGAGVITLGDEPNGYNINKDCGSQHPQTMLDTVKESKAHLGIAVDGDGDRIIVCDDKGQKIPSEQIMAYLTITLMREGKYNGNAVVSTVLANTALERYVASLGMDYFSTKVGERAVVEKMRQEECSIGGEESGHIVALDYGRSGDALVTALIICMGFLKQKKKMSEIFPLFKMDYCAFTSLRVPSKDVLKEIMADDKVQKLLSEQKEKIAGKGRVVLHPSGTEPVIRVWACGSSEGLVKKVSNNLLKEMKRFE